MDGLTAFLCAHASKRFAWGTNDCGLFLASWIATRTGIDPARELRGKYRSREQAPTLLGAATACARDAGLVRTDNPQRGDVAILRMQWGLTGAIKTGSGWAMMGKEGLVFVRHARHAVAWRV